MIKWTQSFPLHRCPIKRWTVRKRGNEAKLYHNINMINWLVCTVMWPHPYCHVTTPILSCDHTHSHVTTPILSCDQTHTVTWPHPYCHMTKPKSYNVFVYIVFQEVSNCLQVSVCDSCVQRSVPPRRRMRCKYDMVARALILSHACTQVAHVSYLYRDCGVM